MYIINTPIVKPVKPLGFKKIAQLFNNVEANAINSREMHAFMKVGTQYSIWIKRRIKEFGAVENVDFGIIKNDYAKKGDFESEDYIVKNDMAKHLGMAEKNKIGYEVRDYFIYMEKLAIFLMQKKVEECDIRTDKKIARIELKAETTINKQIEIIQELKLNRMRTFSGGKISLAKFIKENKIKMSDDDAWNILTDERIVHVKTVCYDRHMLDVIIDPRLATQNTTNGIQFNPRFLEEIFKDFLEEKEAGLFDFEEED